MELQGSLPYSQELSTGSIMSQMNPLNVTPSYFYIILPYTFRLS
jgi:hypothetical protein